MLLSPKARRKAAGETEEPPSEEPRLSERPVKSLRKIELVDDELADLESLAIDKVQRRREREREREKEQKIEQREWERIR